MSANEISFLLVGAVIAIGVIGYLIGKSIGYHDGYGDGFVNGKAREVERLYVKGKVHTETINYPKSNVVRTEHRNGGRWL